MSRSNMSAKKKIEPTPEELRLPLMEAVLSHAAFDGWTRTALDRAAEDVGVSPEMAELAFPRGGIEVLEMHLADADLKMSAALAEMDLDSMRIQDRIKCAVRTRLEQSSAYRSAIQRGIALLSLPSNADIGIKALETTMDIMWCAAGDTSTDFNWYSKRIILSGVYMSTLMAWLSDESEEQADTWAFLDRRIAEVMKFEKAKWDFKSKTANMPSLSRFIGRLRYGAK